MIKNVKHVGINTKRAFNTPMIHPR